MSNLNVNNITPLGGTGGSIGVSGSLNVSGSITLGGTVIANGDIILGSHDNDSVSLVADIDSNIIPNDSATYDLGSSAKQWKDLYLSGSVNAAKITASVGIEVAGAIRPKYDNYVSLGSPAREFKNLYIDGVAYVDELNVDTISASALPTEAASAESGEFYTLSGSQIFASSSNGGFHNLFKLGHPHQILRPEFSSSLFVFQKA